MSRSPTAAPLSPKPWTTLDHLTPEERSWVQALLDFETEELDKAERTWSVGESLDQVLTHKA